MPKTYLAIDKMHLNSCLTLMTLKLYGFYEDLDGADPQYGTPQTDELVDQM